VTPPIVFVDTETTCLGPLARPWEIAVIRRDPPAPQPLGARGLAIKRADQRSVFHVEYEFATLPAGTSPKALEVGGWLSRGAPGSTYLDDLPAGVHTLAASEAEIAHALAELFDGDPVMVGVGVHFDAAVLSSMFQRHGLEPEPWHYALVDLKAATWGWFQSQVGTIATTAPQLQLPMSSEKLAAAIGVEPASGEERHTALGDARWAARWYDRLTGGAQ
jgi:hypothetical protein